MPSGTSARTSWAPVATSMARIWPAPATDVTMRPRESNFTAVGRGMPPATRRVAPVSRS